MQLFMKLAREGTGALCDPDEMIRQGELLRPVWCQSSCFRRPDTPELFHHLTDTPSPYHIRDQILISTIIYPDYRPTHTRRHDTVVCEDEGRVDGQEFPRNVAQGRRGG
jgi:hypothetical protein